MPPRGRVIAAACETEGHSPIILNNKILGWLPKFDTIIRRVGDLSESLFLETALADTSPVEILLELTSSVTLNDPLVSEILKAGAKVLTGDNSTDFRLLYL